MAKGPWGPGLTDVQPRRITFGWEVRGSRMQTGFYLRKLAAAAATDADIRDHVVTNLLPAFRGIVSNQCTITKVDVLNIVTKEGVTHEPTNMLGTWEAAAGPTLTTVVLTLKNGIRQRVGQGRMKLPAPPPNQITGDTVSGIALAVYQTFATALTTNYVDPTGVGQFSLITLNPALAANRPNKGDDPMPAVAAQWYDVVSMRVNPVIHSQRSRRAGVGG